MKREENIFLGFDFGIKRIGVAVGQSVTLTARPLVNLRAKGGKPNWSEILDLINVWQPVALIVGLPVNKEGEEMHIAKKVHNFSNQLKKRFDLPVYKTNEYLTTKSAREEIYLAKGYAALLKKEVDKVSAQLILEQWMSENYR